MTYRKFVKWEPQPIENVLKSKLCMALEAFDNGDAEPLKALEIVTSEPYARIGGWEIDLRPYLRKYWVSIQYYGICEVYAMYKTHIRRYYGSHSVIKIVDAD